MRPVDVATDRARPAAHRMPRSVLVDEEHDHLPSIFAFALSRAADIELVPFAVEHMVTFPYVPK